MANQLSKICQHCKEQINEGAKKCPHCQSDLRSGFKKHPFKYTVVGLFIFFVIMMMISLSNNSSSVSTNQEEPQSILPKNTIEQIEGLAKNAGAYDVTVFKGNDLANSQSEPPYDVFVIYNDFKNPVDCTSAKIALMKTMKALYGEAALSSKISRVKFSANPVIEASLGYEDAKDVKWEQVGKDIMQSIFWDSFPKVNSEPKGRNTWAIDKNGCN